MAKLILMPKQGNTVESCYLSEWLVKEGDNVQIGTPLFGYETDKATFTFEADEEGTFLKRLVQDGDIVPVLEPVGVIGKPGEDIQGLVPKSAASAALTPVITDILPSDTPIAEKVETSHQINKAGTGASPRAKRLAKTLNLDLTQIPASGPNGRILEQDVQTAFSQAQTPEEMAKGSEESALYTIKPLSNIRRLIGKAMSDSLAGSAQLTHTLSYDATQVLAYQAKLKKQTEAGILPRITLNDIVLYAVSRVLLKHPELNANFINQSMYYFHHVELGIATDTPRGLMVPTLRQADTLSLVEIATKSKELTSQAIAGNIDPDRLKNGSFTISNLGTLDIEHFTPIINPPQTGILGVNTITTRVRMDKDQGVVFYQAMGLSLTYDHRALDGAQASRFLKELKLYLEQFPEQIEHDPKGLK